MDEIRYEREEDGKRLAWIFATADRNLLRRCAECLVAELGAQPTERFDGMDQIFLDFIVAGGPLVLQLTEGRGIGVAALGNDALVERVATYLQRRVPPR